jgi:predicted ester cyclase
MIDEIEIVFHRWIEEVWNQGDETTIDELFDADGVAAYQFNRGQKPIRGLTRYKKCVRAVREAFSEIKVTIEQIASDGNKVVAVCTFTGRPQPEEEAETSAAVKVTGLCQMIFENGKIVHIWNNLNLFSQVPE